MSRAFCYPMYTQDEWDCTQNVIKQLKADNLEFTCWMSDESQIVSGCRDEYERGRYEAFRQALDRRTTRGIPKRTRQPTMSEFQPEDSLEIEASLLATENEDLKAKIALKDEILASVARGGIQKDAEIERLRVIITKLSTVVDSAQVLMGWSSYDDLLQEAREATKHD